MFPKAVLKLAEAIPLLEVLPDNKTVTTRYGKKSQLGLCQVIKLTGLDYTGLANDDRINLARLRQTFFANLPTHLDYAIHYQRKKLAFETRFEQHQNEWADSIAQQHMEQFTEPYVTEIFLVISRGIQKLNRSLSGLPTKDQSVEKEALEKQREEFAREVSGIATMLDPFVPTILRHSQEGQSELMSFWGFLINGGNKITTPRQTQHLGLLLALSDIQFPKKEKYVVFEHGDGAPTYAAFLCINSYPDFTHERMFSDLMRLKHPFNISQYVVPYSREETKGKLAKKIGNLQMIPGDFTQARASILLEAANEVEAGEVTFHDHILSFCVYGNSHQHLEEGVAKIRSILLQNGMTLIQEDMNRHAAFFAQFPGNIGMLESRQVSSSSENIADAITFGGAQEGLPACAFGSAPVTLFNTVDGGNFSFTFHSSLALSAPGHTMVIGGTGAGKTTLISFLLMNCLKYQDMKMLVFDSHQGLKLPTTVFGGDYTTVGEGASLSLNPMLLPENYNNKQFLERWIGLLAGGVDIEEQQQIASAINQNYLLPEAERSLNSIRYSLGTKKKGSLLSRLEKWLPSESDATLSQYSYGLFFNAKEDTLAFNKRIVGFDMTTALKNTELLGPFTSYVFHGFASLIDKHPIPHVCFIDEMVKYLENPIFAPFILEAVREWRKRNGVFIGAVQEAPVLTDSDVGNHLIKNITTFILFPSPMANEQSYIQGLGLNQEEFNWIRTPNSNREVMIKRNGGGSVILNVDLSHLGKHLKLFSSEKSDVQKMELLQQQEKWVEHYLDKKEIAA